MTVTGGSRATVIRPAAFTIVDELGHVHHPRVTVVRHAGTTTVTARDVLPVGNGQLRWPPDGRHALVAWDFDLELI